MDASTLKRAAAEAAAARVEEGMVVGLGTGSTADWATRWLATHRKRIRCVPTSKASEKLARELGMDLLTPDQAPRIDVLIDGADECTKTGDMIKGGGGALFREKIVAQAATSRLYVMDSSKIVDVLGRFPLPVEAVAYGWEWVFSRLASMNLYPVLRRRSDILPYLTDNSNVIIDCHLKRIDAPRQLEATLKTMTGVVETGLFLGLATEVFVGETSGVRMFQTPL